jgi:SAM-dependent methyltransferase
MSHSEPALEHYVIQGGEAGKRRLDLLAGIMQPATRTLLNSLGIAPGMRALDLGCGGGHVSFELAGLVGVSGSVTGVDLDGTKLELARQDATKANLANVQFLEGNARDLIEPQSFDFAYARFLLTHLSDPLEVLAVMRESLKPGGIVAVEDIDCSGAFCYPENSHFRRTLELYTGVVRRKGGDPDIGFKLPSLLREAGFNSIRIGLVQPVHLDGEHKRLVLVTLENIRDAVLAEGFAGAGDFEATVEGLAAFTADPTTLVSLPRMFQCWGVRAD